MIDTITPPQNIAEDLCPTEEIQEHSDLRRYRTEIPNIVDDLGLNQTAYRLYGHYKRVAGPSGICFESVRTIAAKCRMSIGSVVNAREELSRNRDELGGNSLITVSRHSANGKDHINVRVNDIWDSNIKRYSTVQNMNDHTVQNTSAPVQNIAQDVQNVIPKKQHIKKEQKQEATRNARNVSLPDLSFKEPQEKEEQSLNNRVIKETAIKRDLAPLSADEQRLVKASGTPLASGQSILAKLKADFPVHYEPAIRETLTGMNRKQNPIKNPLGFLQKYLPEKSKPENESIKGEIAFYEYMGSLGRDVAEVRRNLTSIVFHNKSKMPFAFHYIVDAKITRDILRELYRAVNREVRKIESGWERYDSHTLKWSPIHDPSPPQSEEANSTQASSARIEASCNDMANTDNSFFESADKLADSLTDQGCDADQIFDRLKELLATYDPVLHERIDDRKLRLLAEWPANSITFLAELENEEEIEQSETLNLTKRP